MLGVDAICEGDEACGFSLSSSFSFLAPVLVAQLLVALVLKALFCQATLIFVFLVFSWELWFLCILVNLKDQVLFQQLEVVSVLRVLDRADSLSILKIAPIAGHWLAARHYFVL